MKIKLDEFQSKFVASPFESEYKKIFNKYPTKGIYSYLEKYGDPTKDVEWLKFKEEYE